MPLNTDAGSQQNTKVHGSKMSLSMTLSYEENDRIARARARAAQVESLMGLRGLKVLEVGCGHGDFARVLAEEYGCKVTGTDIMSHETWDKLKGIPNLELIHTDISQANAAIPDDSFDRIVSFVVWEHIRHPWSALKECQRLLQSDGKKYLHAYLYGWPRASHLYAEINEPWLHLTHSPAEIVTRLKKTELPWYFWCNRASYHHYLFYFRKLGFKISYENILREPFDEAFYEKNEQLLGLYPKTDLMTHGFQVVLEFDPEHPKAAILDPVYSAGTASVKRNYS
jgi:ubiquinone/menaquinone biosynthesis C-methylase UbiE